MPEGNRVAENTLTLSLWNLSIYDSVSNKLLNHISSPVPWDHRIVMGKEGKGKEGKRGNGERERG